MIWVTWEIQRRNQEIAAAFDIKLCQFDYRGNRFSRYINLICRTVSIYCKESPSVVFVQNPSIILTVLTLSLKNFLKYKVVVDLHTKYYSGSGLSAVLINLLENYALKKADLTIVTNPELQNLLKMKTVNRCEVLPDKIPNINTSTKIPLSGRKNLVFICTFAADEPVDEIIKSATLINDNIYIYITGKCKNYKSNLTGHPKNVIFTDFLPEEEYIRLLNSADAIVDLTTLERCLVCGAYEAVSLEKPLLTSDTHALRDYFNKGTLYTNNSAEDIARKIEFLVENESTLINEMKSLKKEKMTSWEKNKLHIKNIIKDF